MKGFAKIALSVALIAVIVLSIVVASVAWFTSNPEVDAGEVTLDAARTLTVVFDPDVDGTTFAYRGQVGNVASGKDAPYVYEAGGFSLNVTSLSSDSHFGKVKVEFGTVGISYSTGSIPNVLITDLFHITANVYEQKNDGAFVKDSAGNYFRAYNAETDDGLTRYKLSFRDLSIADDGVLMQTVYNSTLDEDEVVTALFPEGRFELAFTFVFLPDTEYTTKWLAGNYSAIEGYELVAGGDYIGVVSYTTYKAKYHYGLQRYAKSAEPDGNGNYTYTENAEGDYVRVVTSYQPYGNVTKYTNSSGAGEGATNGTYIKVGDSNEYVTYSRYEKVNGFPYSDYHYNGEKFRFDVACSVEEVNNEA